MPEPSTPPHEKTSDLLAERYGQGLSGALYAELRAAPWFCGSLAIHLAALALLLLLPAEAKAPKSAAPKTIQVMDTEEPEEFTPPPEDEPEITDVVDTFDDPLAPVSNDVQVVDDYVQTDLTLDLAVDIAPADADVALDTIDAPPVLALADAVGAVGAASGGGFSGRGGSRKRSGLNRMGGGRDTESAIDRGLAYLARHQAPDGSWKLFDVENHFSGRFGFPKEAHLDVHSDAKGQRHEQCSSPIVIPKNMTLGIEVDHVDDHVYIHHNNTRKGPYPDGGGHGDAQWNGTFRVRKGDTVRIEVISTQVGAIWCVGRYWDTAGPAPEKVDRAPYFRTETGLTGLCSLAFLGAGHTTKGGKYAAVLRKARDFLVSASYKEFGTDLPAPIAYEAPLAIMALAEFHGMDNSSRIQKKVDDLVAMGVKYQLPNGGWPVNMAIDKTGDWHNTAWWLCALHSARLAGLRVPDAAFKKPMDHLVKQLRYIDADRQFAEISPNPDLPRIRSGSQPLMTALAAALRGQIEKKDGEDGPLAALSAQLAREGNGNGPAWLWPSAHVAFDFQGRRLRYPDFFLPADVPPAEPGNDYFDRSVSGFPGGLWGRSDFPSQFTALRSEPNPPRAVNAWYDMVYWYWSGQAVSRMGARDPLWLSWNNQFKPYLLLTQARRGSWPAVTSVDEQVQRALERGDNDGSWPGVFLRDGGEPFVDMGPYGSTAFACLMLEVYYRY